ncbi:Protein scabrous-like Protein [Tribolium castaneum]|uniref:Protein scabrous-like Protein n=2 Tax=Tribolium castaneum TaxID=7070 RepID=A0A139WMA6_TRICA|nr:Protein scabrous-like Protein [Tribolium castaneum]
MLKQTQVIIQLLQLLLVTLQTVSGRMHGRVLSVLFLVSAEIAAFHQPENARFRRARRVRHEQRNVSMSCIPEQLEYRLTRLEVQTAEQSEHIRSELKESNHRLQTLEWQSDQVETALESLQTELEHQHQQTNNLQLDNLEKGLQVVVAALRNINSGIDNLRKNIKHSTFTPNFPANCREVEKMGHNVSGVYRIQPELASSPFLVLCDLESKGGGWTYVQNRYIGLQDFYQNWDNYKIGFGNLGGEFWLGLDHLYQLTGSEVNELLVELEDLDKTRVFAHYAAFSLGSEAEGYSLKVLGGYSGDAGDSLSYHAGSKFSTKDLDQDEWLEGSCAQAHRGAWWYRSCDKSNLNGKYLKGEVPDGFLYQGMYWEGFHGANYSLGKARMMVRPRARN